MPPDLPAKRIPKVTEKVKAALDVLRPVPRKRANQNVDEEPEPLSKRTCTSRHEKNVSAPADRHRAPDEDSEHSTSDKSQRPARTTAGSAVTRSPSVESLSPEEALGVLLNRLSLPLA